MKRFKYNIEQFIRLFIQSLICIKLFNLPIFSHIRDIAYKLLFNTGSKLHVGHNVYISREHQKYNGSIKIGKNVLLAHNVHLDYTGFLEIKDNVKIADSVDILTHLRDIEALRKRGEDINNQYHLIIEENAYIGSHVIILPPCKYIGKNAIIGSGSIITKDVLDNTLYCGNAAVLKKYLDEK